MSEKEATQKQIIDTLNKIITTPDDKQFENVTHTIKFIAKILFNVCFDLDELKIELLKALTGEESGEVNHKTEEEDGRFYS